MKEMAEIVNLCKMDDGRWKEHQRKTQGTPKEHRRIVGHTEITEIYLSPANLSKSRRKKGNGRNLGSTPGGVTLLVMAIRFKYSYLLIQFSRRMPWKRKKSFVLSVTQIISLAIAVHAIKRSKLSSHGVPAKRSRTFSCAAISIAL